MKWSFIPTLGSVSRTISLAGSHAGRTRTTSLSTPVVSVNPKENNMNHTHKSHDIIVTGIHLDLTPSLKTYVQDKVERLFRHEDHIVRIRVELECDRQHDHAHKFVAKAHLQVRGPDINCTADSEEMHKSVDLLIDKIDHVLHKRHGQHKDKRNHPHPIEFNGVELPKAI
jgi:putative sigma-54 modulation protein